MNSRSTHVALAVLTASAFAYTVAAFVGVLPGKFLALGLGLPLLVWLASRLLR